MSAETPWRIDTHVHLFEADAAADPSRWAQARGEHHWMRLVLDGPQGWADVAQLLRSMDAAGVEKAVLMGWYWEHHETCVEQNAFFRKCLKEAPDRLWAFAAAQPRAGQACLDDLERAQAAGFRGIGELMRSVQGFDITSGAFRDLADWATERAWPLCFHVTEPVGHVYPGRVETPLEDFVHLGERFPDLRLILAHWGGGLIFYLLNQRVRRALRNAWFDTAASPLLYDLSIFRSVGRTVPAERILFGSDYPLVLYPKSQTAPEMSRFVREAESHLADPAIVRAVLRENAGALLGSGKKLPAAK